MQKIANILKSKTVLTFIALFIINGFEGVRDLISPETMQYINPILTVLGIYFRINPKQQY